MTDKERAFLEDYGKLCLQYGLKIESLQADADLQVIAKDKYGSLNEYLNYLRKQCD